jgi:hypothetical protein
MKNFIVIICAAVFISNSSTAQGLLNKQELVFTKQDSLRAVLLKKRVVGREVLSFRRVNPKDSTITGSNTIKYQVVQEYNRMQIDLQNPLKFTK